MNLVLIGYRGTGKSAVGAIVAERLGMKRISMDEKISRKVGMSIPEFVEKHGWPAFRDVESEVARELAAGDGIVIDSGGGVIARPENIDALQTNGIIEVERLFRLIVDTNRRRIRDVVAQSKTASQSIIVGLRTEPDEGAIKVCRAEMQRSARGKPVRNLDTSRGCDRQDRQHIRRPVARWNVFETQTGAGRAK